MAVSLINDLVPGTKRKLLFAINGKPLTAFLALQSMKRVFFMFSAPVSLSNSASYTTNLLDSYR